MLTGNDLLALGLRPGKHFPEILAYANTHGLAGEALAAYVAPWQLPAPLPLRPEPLPFHENIRASSVVEQQNVGSNLSGSSRLPEVEPNSCLRRTRAVRYVC